MSNSREDREDDDHGYAIRTRQLELDLADARNVIVDARLGGRITEEQARAALRLSRQAGLEEEVGALGVWAKVYSLSGETARRWGFPGHNELCSCDLCLERKTGWRRETAEPCTCDRCVDDREGPGWP